MGQAIEKAQPQPQPNTHQPTTANQQALWQEAIPAFWILGGEGGRGEDEEVSASNAMSRHWIQAQPTVE